MTKVVTLWGEEKVETFRCIHCKQDLPMHLMSTDSHHTRRCECKPCRSNKAKVVTKLKKEHKSKKPSIKDSCIICLRTGEEMQNSGSFTGKRGVWTLDHNHDTNMFRGWICQHCNNGLGGFKDNIKTMQRAIEYIKNDGKIEL